MPRQLAHDLATHADPNAALATYEATRRPPTSAIVLANRGNGPERVMQMAHERAPEGFAKVEDVIPRSDLEAVAAEYKRLAGFDPAILNARATLSVR